MLRTIMAATAVSALALTSALAQSTTAPLTNPTAAQSAAPAAPAATHATFIARQAPDQWLASKFRGTDVIGAKDEKIGA